MVCYNIAIDKGGMTNEIFLLAFHEIPIMWPIACILEYFVVENWQRCWRSSGKSERRQAGLCDTCNLFYDCMPDVSGNESDCHGFVCTSGKSGNCGMAAETCFKLPNGIMLADLFAGPFVRNLFTWVKKAIHHK
mgnify:CR=1 FL=1